MISKHTLSESCHFCGITCGTLSLRMRTIEDGTGCEGVSVCFGFTFFEKMSCDIKTYLVRIILLCSKTCCTLSLRMRTSREDKLNQPRQLSVFFVFFPCFFGSFCQFYTKNLRTNYCCARILLVLYF